MSLLLSENEFDFLCIFYEQKTGLSISDYVKTTNLGRNAVEVVIDDDLAVQIREMLGDEVALHFNEQYNPTETGIIIERLIDKLYA